MEPRRQKIFARLALAAFAALGALWLARLDYGSKISTNVIDLLPADERTPELSLVRSLVDQRQTRIVLLALATSDPTAPPPAAAVETFVASLQNSSAFADIVRVGDPAANDALGRFVFARRFDFLLPAWLARAVPDAAAPPSAAALAERTVAELDQFLAQPESLAFQELVPHDPLLLVPALAQKVQGLLGAAGAAGSDAAGGTALVWAVMRDSPFSAAGQRPVFTAIETALADARRLAPALTLRWTGYNRFAAASEARIRGEISWLNTASLAGVLGVALIFVRRPWKVLHLVPVIALSTLGAWVATTLVFERTHILVFVLGSLLAGVAIDYGFYLYMQPALRPGEPYREKLRRLLKPLLTSCLTTVIGFSLLCWSELPLVRQLGVFVSAGLLSALAAAILYFAQLDRAFLETRAFVLPSAGRARRLVLPLFALAALVALFGPWLLRWRDDIRELEIPSPALRAEDAGIRRLFGDTAARSVFLTHGATPAAARAALARFTAWHDEQFPATPAASLGLLLPTEAGCAARAPRLAALESFPAALRAELARRGYEAESFAPFFTAWSELRAAPAPDTAALVADLRAALGGPLGMLFHLDPAGGRSWFLTLADRAPREVAPPAGTDTFALTQLESLNALFSRYRADAAKLSALGLGLIGLSVFALYGLRRGARIFAIPAGSCFFALGLLGLAGQPLNLFHLLAAFLGVCMSHNYAIFSAENAGRREPPPPSIRLSALTTAVSFGVLALSKIPVVAALGATVALIVLAALLMVELEPLGRKS
jgi:predicted exporter